jgi:dihydrodipicolinate synthase/N-acetylneuraminate lyase
MKMNSKYNLQIVDQIVSDPVRYMPTWTVALFDPTTGDLPRRKLDVEGAIKYARAISHAGAPGVLVAASTGWGHKRNLEEHRETLEVYGKADLGSTIKQALIRIEDPIEFNIELINDLKKWGYSVIWTRRGTDVKPAADDREIARHLLPLAEASAEAGLPMGIYSVSTIDGAPLKASAASILLDYLGEEASRYIVGVKVTEPFFEDSTQEYLEDETFYNKKIVQGWDSHYIRALKAGIRSDGTNQCGATSGAAACMVYAYDAMYGCASNEDWDCLTSIQEMVNRVFDAMQGGDRTRFPDLQVAKRAMGLGHPLTEERTLQSAEKFIEFIEGLHKNNPGNRAVKLIARSMLIMGNSGNNRSPFYDRLKVIEE